MSIKPLADRVLVRPADQEEKTASGIIIPDSAKEKPLRGEVIAVGGGTKDEEMVLKAGDIVLYGMRERSTSSCVRVTCWLLSKSQCQAWLGGWTSSFTQTKQDSLTTKSYSNHGKRNKIRYRGS